MIYITAGLYQHTGEIHDHQWIEALTEKLKESENSCTYVFLFIKLQIKVALFGNKIIKQISPKSK